MSPTEVHIGDISTMKSVYATRETFRKASWYRQLTAYASHTIFNTDNVEYHRRHRRLLAGPLSETSLQATIPFVTSRADLTIERMAQEMKTRGCVDVYKWWFYFSTDVIGELTFGESFQMLEQGKVGQIYSVDLFQERALTEAQKTQYAQDIQSLGVIAAICSVVPKILPLLHILRVPFFTKAIEASQRVGAYAEESLSKHKRLFETDENSVRTTLFSKVFKTAEDENWPFHELVGDARAYIVAGSDTTSNTLSYLVWAVCRQPEVKSKLLAELKTLPPDYTEADLRNIPYIGHVIEETLRRYPAAPSALPRVVPQGGSVLSGYWLPEGTTVSAQSTTMNMHPDAFDDPDKFNPSRWEEPTSLMKDAFMTFGKGARGNIYNLYSTSLEIAS